ncbi:crossover junction endodeoxyribonuclease RuvC [Candidatus Falkowbacteria bacterium]|nr:crossover junction endodeoxyribonuclease RuvC [Candidatus Falkowbacteria bacterium]
MIILGIDPGLAITGWGVINNSSGQLRLVDFGVIRTAAGQSVSQRLNTLYRELTAIIKQFAPDRVAVEELFFSKNVKTALVVGQARGVILLCAVRRHLPLAEYTPPQVKQAVAAYGKADKKQVQKMVKTLLNLKIVPQPDDAADALAIAICAANSIKIH